MHPPARPKKGYGQHFLQQRHYIDRIVAAVTPQPEDCLIEIGPGEGAITLPLLQAAGKLTVIELDTDLLPALRERAAPLGELTIVQRDVLKVDLAGLATTLGTPRLRIVGNLPYYISSPILFHCLGYAEQIHDMHFMLQKELVDRMAAAPGSKIYGRLSVMLQLACRVQSLFEVPPGAFRPPPKVDSAVVRLIPKPPAELPAVNPERLARLVQAAFAQRRKTLANALKEQLPAAAIRATGIDPGIRAEMLPPEAFVQLTEQPANAP